MPTDAEARAIDLAGDAILAHPHAYDLSSSSCDLLAEAALAAIPADVLARLAVERGGLEQVGWSRQFGHGYGALGVQLFVLDRDPNEHADDVADSTLRPVCRLTQEADRG